MDPYNRAKDSLYMLNPQQLAGLDKHQEMIKSALHWQQHAPPIESTLNRRLKTVFATIMSILAR